jgi:cell division septal protein FtsQ
MNKLIKILNIGFLVCTLGCILYLSLNLKSKSEAVVKSISIEGNEHLSIEQYLSYANLLDKNAYTVLSLQVIKDRLEKHPYVKHADVRYNGDGKVTIKIIEKVFESLLLKNEEQYLLTDRLQILPILPQTMKIDIPVISVNSLGGGFKVFSSLRNNYLVVTAVKLIAVVKLLNPELYDNLSSVDLQNDKDIIVDLSSVNYQIKLGRGNELNKIICFSHFWNYLKGKELNKYMEYVDLRYSGHVYLGIIEPGKEEEIKKS